MSQNISSSKVDRRFLNHHWVEYHLSCARRMGMAVVRGVKADRICSGSRILKEIVPVYRRMNLAWNGSCFPKALNLRTLPANIVFEWSQMPVDLWNYEFIVAGRYGMVKLDKRKKRDRRIPMFLRESLLQDLTEGIGELESITQFSEDLVQIRISLAHSYRHINFAVNSAISMTLKDFRNFDDHDKNTMPVFYDFSRWPEAVVRELGPEWVIELQERLKIK